MKLFIRILLLMLFLIRCTEIYADDSKWDYLADKNGHRLYVFQDIRTDGVFKTIILKIDPPSTSEFDHIIYKMIINMQDKKYCISEGYMIRTNPYQGKQQAEKEMEQKQIKPLEESFYKMAKSQLYLGNNNAQNIILSQQQVLERRKNEIRNNFEKQWIENYYATKGVIVLFTNRTSFESIRPDTNASVIFDYCKLK